ncbi:hypothetical protein B9Z65_2807 [Elsinoe australis]|uniref:tRNA (guanine(10)-N(2))-methyltransferase n=1 Tax=Elsinoe australis TaxID=40998 RepID=A0A2P8A4Q8_9PEZI|nr:hypothetical protein B9Z65_2807 [Elsinoe australis]
MENTLAPDIPDIQFRPMDEYLVRFVQLHETFRLPELQALADFHGIEMEVVDYRASSPFAIIRLPSSAAARLLIFRSVLSLSISHLWGHATSYTTLHADLQATRSKLWPPYHLSPFRFNIDTFQSKRSHSAKTALINSFSYMDLQGPIRPFGESVPTFVISEEFEVYGPPPKSTSSDPPPVSKENERQPLRVFLSLHLADSGRAAVTTYDLKKRTYISTTSMDAELSLVSANLALAGSGRVVYDPFCGTGSFLVAAAHFGASVVGSDLDGRVIRGRIRESRQGVRVGGRRWVRERKMADAKGVGGGKGGEKEEGGEEKGAGERKDGKEVKETKVEVKGERSVRGNLKQYGLEQRWLDGFVSDLTNSPVRIGGFGQDSGRWIDAIVCDPPYGVREGLKVLGSHKPELQEEVIMKDGSPAHLSPGYIPPKRPYSFDAMLADILTFAANVLVDRGRLCMWVPVENVDEEGDTGAKDVGIPTHPCLRLCSVSTQEFTRWSRRLIVYARLPDRDIDGPALKQYEAMRKDQLEKGTADELNEFRKRFFEGFRPQSGSSTPTGTSTEQTPPTRLKAENTDAKMSSREEAQ